MMGYSISYVLNLEDKNENGNIYHVMWITIDCLTSLLLIAYVNLSAKFILSGEITRNISSLHFLQRKLMNEDEALEFSKP